MHTPIKYRIKGISPLMLHNGHLADPLNPFAQAMKKINSKRSKTDGDYAELASLEWSGSLYLDDKKRIVIPGQNIESMLIESGKKRNLGTVVKIGVLCDGDWVIEHEGPKDIEKLKDDPRFRDIRGVKIQKSRIMRCRPIFSVWSLSFTVHFLPDTIDAKKVTELVDYAGRNIGLGDYKPKFGRFQVVA